jgi:hypothetical protein
MASPQSSGIRQCEDYQAEGLIWADLGSRELDFLGIV